jgi:hypothetical protein
MQLETAGRFFGLAGKLCQNPPVSPGKFARAARRSWGQVPMNLPSARPAAPEFPALNPPPAMAKPSGTPRELVDRLDARHDELIAKLDELNAQIEAVLSEFSRSREAAPSQEQIRKAA